MIPNRPPPCHEGDPSGSTQGPTYETWTDREYVYHAAAGAQLDEFIVQIDRTGAPMYMLQDAGLNVVGLVDQSGDVIRQDTYAPYGEVVATDLFNLSFGDNRVGWKGLFFDRLMANALGSQLTPGGVGLYRARNRTYSPTLGRWLQRDPFGSGRPVLEQDPLTRRAAHSEDDCCGPGAGGFAFDVDAQYFDGMDAFLFARGNPVVGTDPLGLSIGILVGINFDLTRAARDVAAGAVAFGLATLAVAGAWEWVKATEIAITLTDVGDTPGQCLPCEPPVGTGGFRVDPVVTDGSGGKSSRPHYPFTGTHTHHFVVHQSPPSAGCKCFWVKTGVTDGVSPAPGEVPMAGTPGGGGLR